MLNRVLTSFTIGITAALITACSASVTPASAAECGNEQLRVANDSTQLPDCRAYELVTPVDTNGVGNNAEPGEYGLKFDVASADGQRVVWESSFPLGNSPTSDGDVQLATRTSEGWESSSLAPLESSFARPDPAPGVYLAAVSPDLSSVLLNTTASLDPVDHRPEVFSAGAERPSYEIYLRKPDGTFSWITQGPLGDSSPGPAGFEGIGSSSDLSRVVFSWPSALVPEANGIEPGYTGLYERTNGQLQLLNVNTNGSLINTCGATLGGKAGNFGETSLGGGELNDVSHDGSRVFFETATTISPKPLSQCMINGQPIEPQLYVRENNQTTVDVSAPEQGSPEYGFEESRLKTAIFEGATPDGSYVFFRSAGALTPDANTANGAAQDLYGFDIEGHRLTDLSASSDPEGAQVQSLDGVSEDGGRVYFTARGQIGGHGIEGGLNLYLWTEGEVRYIATPEVALGLNTANAKRSEMTPDGSRLLFVSTRNLSSYDSRGFSEIYEYNESSNQITCVSCDPNGAPPTGNATLTGVGSGGGLSSYQEANPIHSLTDEGSYAFFDSPDALVRQDTNGVTDVYEYHEGQVQLLSSGTSQYPSVFEGATASGSDVYFATADRLSPRDIDGGGLSIYDARIAGGLPAPLQQASCSGEECQGPLSATLPTSLSSGSAAAVAEGGLLATIPAPVSKAETSAKLNAAQKLARAIAACHKKSSKARRACEKQARKKYAPPKHKRSAPERKPR